ncbi:MAG TPA: hypothetical protein ENK97_03225 [Campylobacteraceae bacterium]|nr:hypothetical protein [Campylobacteraceae bacterium]
MQLRLENIGMIKEADVAIDGLTVIAGENDTGKSTVGKSLFLVFKYAQEFTSAEHKFEYYFKMEKLLFETPLKNGSLWIDDKCLIKRVPDQPIIEMDASVKIAVTDVMMIETPVVWNFFKFFNAIEKIKTEASFFDQNYQIPYPYLMWDIYRKLSLPKQEEIKLSDKKSLLDQIESIIKGKFTKDDFGDFVFVKENKKVPIINTATGIKQFGILQKLIENNYLHQKSIVIFDEPEVHLHPKWQLKMAELIVMLVQNGVKIVVNSHSPYMIEALKRYAERDNRDNIDNKTNFYLAENGYIGQTNGSNSETLREIFEKLSEPFEKFDEMDMENILNG